MKISQDLFNNTITISGIEIDVETLMSLLWRKLQTEYQMSNDEYTALAKLFDSIWDWVKNAKKDER